MCQWKVGFKSITYIKVTKAVEPKEPFIIKVLYQFDIWGPILYVL